MGQVGIISLSDFASRSETGLRRTQQMATMGVVWIDESGSVREDDGSDAAPARAPRPPISWLARLGAFSLVGGVVRAVMADAAHDEGKIMIGLAVAALGALLLLPTVIRFAGRLVFGAAKVGARQAGRLGREMKASYRDGRDG